MTKINDSEEFRRMWHAGEKSSVIAQRFACAESTVRQAARRAGLPPRPPGMHKRPPAPVFRTVRSAPPAPVFHSIRREMDAPRVAMSEAHATRDFDAARDCKLVETGGKYAALRALADEWGLPVSKLQARWHLVRAR